MRSCDILIWKNLLKVLIDTVYACYHFLLFIQFYNSCLLFGLKVLGTCEIFEEKQVGNERFNIFSGCPSGRTATIVLRGGADQVGNC